METAAISSVVAYSGRCGKKLQISDRWGGMGAQNFSFLPLNFPKMGHFLPQISYFWKTFFGQGENFLTS